MCDKFSSAKLSTFTVSNPEVPFILNLLYKMRQVLLTFKLLLALSQTTEALSPVKSQIRTD